MMDMHSIVSGAIGTVNPPVTAYVYQSTGYTTSPSGKQSPSFAAPVTMEIQKQELSFKELQHVNQLNIQGIMCSVYLEGSIYGVDRGTAKGGDMFVINNVPWLVVAVSEQWPDWCKIILCQQLTGPVPGSIQ